MVTLLDYWISLTISHEQKVKIFKKNLLPGAVSGKSKSCENAGRINLTKAQQGFGVLSVALGSQALTLTSMLLEDLSSEIRGDDTTYDEVSLNIEILSQVQQFLSVSY